MQLYISSGFLFSFKIAAAVTNLNTEPILYGNNALFKSGALSSFNTSTTFVGEKVGILTQARISQFGTSVITTAPFFIYFCAASSAIFCSFSSIVRTTPLLCLYIVLSTTLLSPGIRLLSASTLYFTKILPLALFKKSLKDFSIPHTPCISLSK